MARPSCRLNRSGFRSAFCLTAFLIMVFSRSLTGSGATLLVFGKLITVGACHYPELQSTDLPCAARVLVAVCHYMPRPISSKTTLGKARATLGITAAQLQQRSGVGLSTIQKIERNRHPLTESTAKKLGHAMWVDPVWLLYGDPSSEPKNYVGDGPFDANGAKAASSLLRGNWTVNPPSQETIDQISIGIEKLKTALETVICDAMICGNVIPAMTDIDLAIRGAMKQYAPGLYAERFEDLRPPAATAKKASRKR